MLLQVQETNFAPVVEQLFHFAGSCRVWGWEGEMGAGKTTLIRAVCRQLGIQDLITSPTFAIVNEYQLPNTEKVYHFDGYRLKQPEEAWELDCPAYFASGAYCFVEWPQHLACCLPAVYMRIQVLPQKDGSRLLEVTQMGKGV